MPVAPGQKINRASIGPERLPPLAATLGDFFRSRGITAYLVGGVVRDALLDRQTKDIDVAVDADIQVVGRDLASAVNGRFVPLDPAGEVVRIVVRSNDVETTVDLNSVATGLDDDLARRDFTLDALAVPLSKGATEPGPGEQVIDRYDGLSDLDTGLIRAVSPGVFEDDPVRLLRAVRLAVQLRFRLDDDTAVRIRSDAHLLSQVAGERVRDELLKLLAEPGSTESVKLLDNLGLLDKVLPQLTESRGVSQPREHYWDVLGHLYETPGQVERILDVPTDGDGWIANAVPRFDSIDGYFSETVSDGHSRKTLLKLAGLLHDIAKPATKTIEESGRIRFLGHHTLGADMTEAILKRIRLSGRGVELVRLMVEHHLRPSQMAQKGEMPTGRAIYRYYRDVGDAAIDTLYLNMADYLAARGPLLEREEWSQHCGVVGHILREGLRQNAPEVLPKLITGHDIMEAVSLSPGPEVGLLLDVVREAQAAGEVTTKEEAIDLVKTRLELGDSGA